MKKIIVIMTTTALLAGSTGCRSGKTQQQQNEFFTSGSREADQRATQRMAREQQLAGTGGKGATGSGSESKAGDEERKLTLFERLGGEQGITAIVDDFTARVIEDPRVNWQRQGVKRSRLFGRDESVAWSPSTQNIARLKKHMVQFFALATGGPPQYDGQVMRSVHAGMRISNPEFDAAVGDLKASLDKLKIPTKEQKELLAIVESTRPQIVTER